MTRSKEAMENLSKYKKELEELFNSTTKEEWNKLIAERDKLQKDFAEFNEHCKNYSENVQNNFVEKLTDLKQKISNEADPNFFNDIDNTTFLMWILMSK